jgi:hypothetical protein
MRSINIKISETELAQCVVNWLIANGWEVFQEVRLFHQGSPIADIVARRGQCVWIIECKTSFNADVVEQAYHWLHYAHIRSIAYPKEKRQDRTKSFLKTVAGVFGVGLLKVDIYKGYNSDLNHHTIIYKPGDFEKHPRLADKVIAELKPEHQQYSKAGTKGGGYYTPFKHTCQQIVAYVREHPGSTIKEILENVQHHYKSYKGACIVVAKDISNGIITGIYPKKEGNDIRYYPTPN